MARAPGPSAKQRRPCPVGLFGGTESYWSASLHWALVTDLLLAHGLLLLFALVAMESAGVPLPGETALIAASILAERGHYSLVAVIAVAAAAAIVGDNAGYWIGRRGGRSLLRRAPIVGDHFERALPRSERFFHRHGAKTVFLGRFIAVLRVTAAWLAGISHMPWWRFLLWNAAGGIAWAVLVGVVAYVFGRKAADAIAQYGLLGALVVLAVAVVVFVVLRIWRNRALEGT
jgi:membrane protein DedA with SNARE-associated domain